jgi:alpha-beta hydrolase superfamily lysophospholipase
MSMGRRIATSYIGVAVFAVWLLYVRHLSDLWVNASILLAVVVGCALGAVITLRWMAAAALPLVGSTLGGLALSALFSNTHPLSGQGDWSARATVAFAGVWCGLLATGFVLVTVLLRATLYRPLLGLLHSDDGHQAS